MGPGIHIFPAIEKPHVSLAAEKLFSLFGLVNVTNSMLTMFIVMLALVLFFAYATRRIAGGDAAAVRQAPHGAQNVAEFIVESLLNLVESTAGKQIGRRILPLVATFFLFILAANYTGLLPGVGTIGFCEVEGGEHASQQFLTASAVPLTTTGTVAAADAATSPGCAAHPGTVMVPFFRAPNADLNQTIAMALIAVVTVQIMGIRAHGVGGYLKEFLNPIHLIGELSRIISLSARLFGNIFGGEVLLAVIVALTLPLVGLLGIVPAIFYGLELFFGFIQALLFSLLTLIYVAVAAAGHGDHEEHHEHGPAGVIERGAEELAVGAGD